MRNSYRKIPRPIILAMILPPLATAGTFYAPESMFYLISIASSAVALICALGILLAIARKTPRIIRALLFMLCAATLSAALLAATSFTAYFFKFGSAPSPEVLNFLRNNIKLIPSHVLQTAPLLSILSLSLSLAVTCIALIWISRRLNRATDFHPTAMVVTGVVALAISAGMTRYAPPPAMELAAKLPNPAVTAYLDRLSPRSGNAPLPVERQYPVVVILVESLRHDLLTTYAQDIPFLRKLAEENVTFNRAYATASHSNLTDLAFWYSQYPLRGLGKESYPVGAAWRGSSLFSAFKDAGYGTAYISSQNERWGDMINWLDTPDLDYFFHSENFSGSTWENHDDKPGLASLIKRGIATAGKVEDSQTLEVAKSWIINRANKKTFFVGMNLQNTHYSYVIPPGGLEPHQPAELGFQAVYYTWPKEKAGEVKNRYLNAVNNVDKLLEGFADSLKRQGLWDECLFVVLGDNGEGFYEHGFGNHSGPMYDEAVRTLAIIKPPKSLRIPAQEIDQAISHIDLAATVLHLSGIAIPESFQGRPVLNSAPPDRPVLMYSNAMVRQFGVVDWPWKYLSTEHPIKKEELYNLSEDMEEKLNLASSSPEILKKMRATGDFWKESQIRYYSDLRYRIQSPPIFNRSDLLNTDKISSAP